MMDKEDVQRLLDELCAVVLSFIKERESLHTERWVPAVEIKRSLALDRVPYPRASGQNDPKGWLFAILARQLEDRELIEYKREGSRSFCRSTK